ncbi:hypothetical protein [Pseudomonas sp. TCU-HL1]|uniref:hypothetical protein n=1 Tax=Pseudomonas sp. TCU-HL1 TaxID=1856685 RepID=UPI0011AB2FA1|nr:hypothetical protein [Pseudomonas sp. TCU-HL1]
MPMDELSRRTKLSLIKAQNANFSWRVTGYLTDVHIFARSGVGRVFSHRSSRKVFKEGTTIRTSDVIHLHQDNGFWVLHTTSGSFYVIATFERKIGWYSLMQFRASGEAKLRLPWLLLN